MNNLFLEILICNGLSCSETKFVFVYPILQFAPSIDLNIKCGNCLTHLLRQIKLVQTFPQDNYRQCWEPADVNLLT